MNPQVIFELTTTLAEARARLDNVVACGGGQHLGRAQNLISEVIEKLGDSRLLRPTP
jgi:hypothetical protein